MPISKLLALALLATLTLTGLGCNSSSSNSSSGPGMDAMATLLTALAAQSVSVDFFSYADLDGSSRQLQVTIPEDDVDRAQSIARQALADFGLGGLVCRKGLSRVTLVGGGMAGIPGVYAKAVDALRGEKIDVYAFSTSAMTISVLVDSEKEERTLQLLHSAFDLAKVG